MIPKSLEPTNSSDTMSSSSESASDSGVSVEGPALNALELAPFTVDNDGLDLLDITVVNDNEDHIVGQHGEHKIHIVLLSSCVIC
jgi:hypothetical protein